MTKKPTRPRTVAAELRRRKDCRSGLEGVRIGPLNDPAGARGRTWRVLSRGAGRSCESESVPAGARGSDGGTPPDAPGRGAAGACVTAPQSAPAAPTY